MSKPWMDLAGALIGMRDKANKIVDLSRNELLSIAQEHGVYQRNPHYVQFKLNHEYLISAGYFLKTDKTTVPGWLHVLKCEEAIPRLDHITLTRSIAEFRLRTYESLHNAIDKEILTRDQLDRYDDLIEGWEDAVDNFTRSAERVERAQVKLLSFLDKAK